MTFALWNYRRFILINALADLRHRFSGSVVGYLWNVFVPLAQIAVFAMIFSVFMGYQTTQTKAAHGTFTFIIYLCSGLLPWNAFAETLIRNSGSLVSNAGFLRKLPMPEQIFVAKETMSGFFQTVVTLVLFALFAVAVAKSGWHMEWLQAIPMLMLFMGFAYGLGLILSTVNVFFRDIQPLMSVLVLLWMWLTPVVYSESIFADPKHPHPFVLKMLHLNPAYHFINGFQVAIYKADWIEPGQWLDCALLCVVVNLLAIPILAKLRAEIRDAL